MNQIPTLAAALVLIGYGGSCIAQSDTPLHITRAVLEPKTGAVTIQGTLDCLTSGLNGPADVIASLRQDPIGRTTRVDELSGAAGGASTITEKCRGGQVRKWSMVVESFGNSPFGPGSKAHLVVFSVPNDPPSSGVVLVSAETDVTL